VLQGFEIGLTTRFSAYHVDIKELSLSDRTLWLEAVNSISRTVTLKLPPGDAGTD
jgi:hypothetical protein